MTVRENQKTNCARGKGAAPHRLCLAAPRFEGSDVAKLSFANHRPRSPPVTG